MLEYILYMTVHVLIDHESGVLCLDRLFVLDFKVQIKLIHEHLHAFKIRKMKKIVIQAQQSPNLSFLTKENKFNIKAISI